MRLLANLVGAALAGFVVVVLVAAAIPMAFGDRTFVVRSGSMTPVIRTGDVVAVRPIRPTQARVGDIVTFDNHGRLTSHRVRSIVATGDQLAFVTQGDANTGQEHWRVAANGTIGRVVSRVPMLGFVVVQVRSTLGRLLLIALPALLLGLVTLRSIWRPDPDPDPDPAPEATPDGLAV